MVIFFLGYGEPYTTVKNSRLQPRSALIEIILKSYIF